jgi:hypothetical protein
MWHGVGPGKIIMVMKGIRPPEQIAVELDTLKMPFQ